jgi:hypothetical protein
VGYSYNIAVYGGRGRICVTATVMATHAAMTELTLRIEYVWHKVFMKNLFLSPDLFISLLTECISYCVVRPNCKRMRSGFGKKPKLKQGDID